MSLHPIVKNRYSPKSYQDRSLTLPEMNELMEAAGRAASSFHEQPWAYVFALRSDTSNFEKILGLINERNREWAAHAGALAIAFAKKSFNHNGRENKHAWHDVGMSINTMTFQANSMGIFIRQMAGFDANGAEIQLEAPDNYEAVSAIALGYPDLAEMEYKMENPMVRRPIQSFSFSGKWNNNIQTEK